MLELPKQFSDFDQTQFSLEEPMYENLASLPAEPKPVDTTPKVPLFKQKKFIIGAIAGTIVLVVLILVVINTIIANSRKLTPEEITPLPTASPAFSHPIEQKINFVRQELDTFEDDQSTLVNPAVDYTITIDPIKE